MVVHFPDLGLSDSWSLSQLDQLFLQVPNSRSSVCPNFLATLHTFLGVDPSNLRMAGMICFLYLYTLVLPHPLPMEIHVSSDIPLGAGLGSSAALGVCLAAGLLGVTRQVGFDILDIFLLELNPYNEETRDILLNIALCMREFRGLGPRELLRAKGYI